MIQCYCGKGCPENRQFFSLTNPRIRSKADYDVYESRFEGLPVPADSDPEDAPARSGGTGTGPGMSAEDRATIAEGNAYLDACKDRDAGTLNAFVLNLLVERERGWRADRRPFRMTVKMAEALIRIRDREAATQAAQPRLAEVFDWLTGNMARNTFARSLVDASARYGSLTQNQYDAVLRSVDAEKARGDLSGPPADAVNPSSASPEGWYRVDGIVYKVQQARQSRNLYAKRLVIADGTGSWEYAPGMIRNLTEADRLTVEEASAMGRLYGICMVCGARLTDESSIARGIGPVCATRL